MDIAEVTIVILACVALWFGYKADTANKRAATAVSELATAQSDLDTERRLRAADQAAVLSVNKKLTALKAQKGKTDAQLKAALVAEPDWANNPVPDSVRAALRVRHATND